MERFWQQTAFFAILSYMRCPSCQAEDTRVIDSRVIEEGGAIRRRRQCSKCEFRFSTLEEVEILSLMVDKSDGSEEAYDKDKLMRSMRTALQKREISPAKLKKAVHRVEQQVQMKAKKDHIQSSVIGEIVMRELRKLDKVAYVRFASVYRAFEDVSAFADELKKLKPRRKKSKKSKK